MPHRNSWRRSLAVTTAVSSLLLLSITNGASIAGAAPATSTAAAPAANPGITAPLGTVSPKKTIANRKLTGALAERKKGQRSVFVQFSGPGAASVSASSIKQGKSRAAAKVAAQARKTAARKTTSSVVAEAKTQDRSTKVLFQVSNAVPGVAVTVTDDALAALAARTDVVKISAIVPKTVSNSSVAQLVKAINTWQSVGDTGAGVKVGIIDTGIDYTHADFGGVGTVAAWEAAHGSPASTFVPTAKVVGGYDFVGDSYQSDPASADYQPVPEPDSNPIDCNGHGTHVSGTAAGLGVNADGSTFSGNYATLTGATLDAMKIGPGMAPNASLYGLKVFGCEGSTDAVIPAMDWALDPNGDGDFSDHLDIVNLSLGSDYSAADDPENDVVDQLSANGVLPVIAAGNHGDLTDTAGSPGNAISSLAVASSVDAYQLRDGLRVNAPAGVAGIAAGQFSVAYPWATAPDVTGGVVALSAANADGCAPLSAADQAVVAGKVAWLIWDDNDATRACGSVGRSGNVATAGAIGAIFTSGRNVFGAGITGSAVIPVVQLPKVGTDALAPAVAAGTLNVTFDGSLQATIKDITPAIVDTLSSFSSRGTHGAPGVVKPDVAAPGDTVASAGMGSGNGVLVESGTSMATPVTAGVAALVKKKHPTWSPEQIKAAIMNTAGHDVYTGENKTGNKYGPARVGAGRIDALAAVSTKVIAYNLDNAGAVSASFGVVEAPITKPTVTRTQTVRVQNTDTKAVTVQLGYEAIVTEPGVSYSVSPSSIRIKPSGSANVRVKMTVTTKQLRRTLDPTMQATQTDPKLGVDRARQFVTDASGRLLVKQLNKANLRVPVYGAAKPTSKTTATDAKTKGGKPAIVLRGNGVSQGSGSTQFQSKASILDLGYKSPKQPVCLGASTAGCVTNATTRSGDLQYVGAGATPAANGSKADGWLYFGISTYGDWATIGNTTIPYVDYDTDGDGLPDFETYVANQSATDLLTAFTVDLATGELVDLEPVNFNDGDVDTNVFDTNVLLLPVWPAAIGMTDATKSFPITYSVGMNSGYASSETGGDLDHTPAITFDAAAPKVQVAGPLYPDRAMTTIPYKLNVKSASPYSTTGAAAAAKKPIVRTADALVIHLQGATGKRAEVLKVKG